MSNIRTVKLSIGKVLEGSDVNDSFPAGWLGAFYDRIKACIPAAEWNTARVRGAANIYIEYQHALSPEEVRQERLEQYEGTAQRIRELLPRQGEALSADRVDAIRRLLA